ncbi:hypothetical protein HRbin10_02616 [bacterium HR10]|nr:hypothetical protein HRbin10_02616 [bacterium HR10]
MIRRLPIEAVRAIEEPVEGRLRRRLCPVHRIAADRPIGEAQREGGIGIDRFAEDGEARAPDLRPGRLTHARDVLLEPALHLAEDRVHAPRPLDQRIGRSHDGLFSSIQKSSPNGDIGEARPPHQFTSDDLGRPSPQSGLDERIIRPQLFKGLLQAGRDQHLLQSRIDRRGREHAKSDRLQLRIMKPVQTLGIRFLHFRRVAHERQGVLDQVREAATHRPIEQWYGLLAVARFGGGDLRPRAPIFGLPLGSAREARAQLLLLPLLLRHERRVAKAIPFAHIGLHRVLQAEDQLRGLPRRLWTLRRILPQHMQSVPQGLDRPRIDDVPQRLQLRDGQPAARPPRMPGDEDQFSLARPLRVPPQVVLRANRPPILVHAKEREIQAVSGIREIVGIATEEGDLLLRREDQTHIGIALVAVEPVFGSVIERHDLRMRAGRLAALPLDARDLRPPSFERLALAHAGSNRGVHPRRHVLHLDEHVKRQVRALQLLPRRAGVKAIAHVILLGGGHLLQLRERDVMVGEHKSIRAHERSRPSVAEAHAGESKMIEPILSWREPVSLAELR